MFPGGMDGCYQERSEHQEGMESRIIKQTTKYKVTQGNEKLCTGEPYVALELLL